jgi:hypothetical protein
MAVIVSFTDYTPVPRFDAIAWTDVEIEEADNYDGAWSLLDTQPLVPVDADPSDPAARSFTVLGTESELWYRVRFKDANGDYSEYTEPVENVPDDTDATPYATVAELASILKVNAVTNAEALERVLTTAALEIDSELGRYGAFGVPYPALVVEVNLERAVEHWQQMKSPFGLVGIGGEFGAERTARDTWERHAHKLAPLKASWGLA